MWFKPPCVVVVSEVVLFNCYIAHEKLGYTRSIYRYVYQYRGAGRASLGEACDAVGALETVLKSSTTFVVQQQPSSGAVQLHDSDVSMLGSIPRMY